MTSAKKLLKLAKKWQRLANMKRKRISFPRATRNPGESCNTPSVVADKGHFVVYTADQRRFVLPLEYLNKEIFKELFRMSEEEFGLPRNGAITLPCDAVSMEYVVAMIQQKVAKDLEKALVMSISNGCYSSSSYLPPDLPNKQILICSF
ncbi:hypothetical protein ACB092_07G197500 [Castanea dentata]